MAPDGAPRIRWDLAWPDWLARLAQCPNATFFHTPEWLEGMARVFGGRPRALLAEWSDRDWALWPLTEKNLARGRLRHAVSGETGVYGGPIVPRPLATQRAWALYRTVSERWPNLTVTGNPALDPAWFAPPPGARLDVTHRLRPAAVEPSRGCKTHLNRALKAGYEVASRPGGDAAGFADLHAQAIRRWGARLTWQRPEAYYRALLEIPGVWSFSASKGGDEGAMLVAAVWGDTAHYIAGATGADHLAAGASNLVMAAFIRWAHDHGLAQVDLGPSQGLEGVIRFKESFGARPAAFYRWDTRSPAGLLYDRARAWLAPRESRSRM